MIRLFVWTGVIVLAVVPWMTYQPHSHWAKVVWIPFSTPPEITARDVLGNLLLYVPFGYLLSRAGSWRPALGTVCLVAAVLSIATELTQVYSHSRFPSATDVLLNVVGAVSGCLLSRNRQT